MSYATCLVCVMTYPDKEKFIIKYLPTNYFHVITRVYKRKLNIPVIYTLHAYIWSCEVNKKHTTQVTEWSGDSSLREAIAPK